MFAHNEESIVKEAVNICSSTKLKVGARSVWQKKVFVFMHFLSLLIIWV